MDFKKKSKQVNKSIKIIHNDQLNIKILFFQLFLFILFSKENLYVFLFGRV